MARYWRLELDNASKVEKDYRKNAKDLIEKYSGEKQLEFNILWSNVETLKPAVYSNTAIPDVRRRFKDKDPLGREMAQGIERAIRYSCEEYDFDENVRLIRDEMLITGRGVGRIEYEVETDDVEYQNDIINQINGFLETTTYTQEEIITQEVEFKYVGYDDFRMSPAKCWDDVRWVAFRHTPTRKELIEQFDEKGAKVPLTHSMLDSNGEIDTKANEELLKRACVWEIWDKENKERVWYAEGMQELLEKEEDPYNLQNFFPMPKPLYAYRVPGTMVPRSEYEIYRKQVETLAKTTRKINELNDQLKVAGIYNSVQEEAQKLLTATNGKFIPITSMAMDKPIRDMIAWWPVEEVAKVLVALYQAQDNQIQIIYQITGLSDIVRGATKASETATAQGIKGNFAQMRMNPRTQPMQEMLRDVFNLKAEIIAENFTAETLTEMTGTQFTPEMMRVLRDDKLRCYRIDVETDSTVQPDADADKQRRIEFLQAVTQFIGALAPLVQAGAIPVEVAREMLSFGARGFKVGRQLEDALDSIGQGQQGGQQQQAQSQNEAEKTKMQADMLMKREELQTDIIKTQMDNQTDLKIAEMKAMGVA